MSTHGHAPAPIGALRSLAQAQLQVQASRAATLDARAVGVMGIDAALAAIVAGAPITQLLRIISLVMLGLSAGLAARSLLLDGAERIGPPMERLPRSRDLYDDDAFEESILDRLTADLSANERALGRKGPRLTEALIFVAIALLCTLAGSV